MATLIGKTLKNRYRVDDLLGHGGMAEVYKVYDLQRGVPLAMKVLREDLAEDRVFLRRFQREAQNLAKLQHPNIVRFYGLEQEDRLAFILMDYIEGSTLRGKIFDAHGPLSDREVLEIMEPVCSALSYAHQQGIVHCDLKSANIMIDKSGRVYLTDFGIARMTDMATSTMVGVGTPAYMAPELIRGEDPTPQTDIYALGIVLFEMLTGGNRPFTGERADTTGTTAEKVRWEQENLPPEIDLGRNDENSQIFTKCILQCLEKQPEKRFQNIEILLQTIKHVTFSTNTLSGQNDTFGIDTPDKLPEIHKREKVKKKNNRSLLAITGIFLLFLGVILIKMLIIDNNSQKKGVKILQPTPTIEIPFSIAGIDNENVSNLQLYKKIGYGQIIDVIYSPDGETLVVGTQGGVYSLDPITLDIKAQFQIENLGAIPTSLDISNDGKKIALGLSNGDILFFDPVKLGLISKITIPNSEVIKIKISSDGKKIACSTTDFRVYLWDIESNSVIHEFTGFADNLSDISFSIDDSLMATSSYDGNVMVWNLDSYQREKTFYDFEYGAVAVKFSPDNTMIAMAENMDRVMVYKIGSWDPVSEFHTEHMGTMLDLEFSHDSQKIATCSIRNEIRIWDVLSGKLDLLLDKHESYVYSVSFSKDDLTLASGSLDGTVRTWALNTGEQKQIKSGFMDFSDFVYVPKNKEEIYSSFGNGSLGVWNISNNFTNTRILNYPRFFMDPVAFSEDGQTAIFTTGSYVLVGSMDEDFIPFATEKDEFESAVYGLAITADKKVIAAGGYDKTVKIFDLETESVVMELSPWDEAINYLYFSPDGNQLVIVYDEAIIQVDLLNYESEPSMRLMELDAPVSDIQQSSNREKIFISFSNGEIGEYDIAETSLHKFELPIESKILQFDFNFDNSILAIAREEGVVQFWDVNSQIMLSDLKINNGEFYEIDDMAFSDDDKYFFVLGNDSILRVYAISGNK